VSRLRLLSPQRGVDLLVVAGAIGSGLGTVLRDSPPPPDGAKLWLEVVAVASVVLTLLGRRRFPFAAPAATWISGAALSFVDGGLITTQPSVFVAGMGAALLLGNLPHDREAMAGLAIVIAGAAIVVQNQDPSVRDPGELAFTPLMFAVAWLAGHVLRRRAEETQAAEGRADQALRDRETAARLAVAEERARIARELHDVVAHALSVMVLQVGAVRRRLTAAQVAELEALRNVEDAGRSALGEMRRLLDGMRAEDDEVELRPQPGLGDLETLVEEVRATGLDVRLRVHGDRSRLPPAVELSGYRIVQEGLTNTLKHAGARQADVEVRYGPSDVTLTVCDDGAGAAEPSDGHGHGLLGIRERVGVLGGDMWAGAVDGGFLLRVRVPLARAES
jgi:signal transduction histidine kinase